ncbi:uncharacterized protein LOC109599330 [Aethina tumida]|uniref:uncharacterized protein LOC109599330 n=1 Tax=Aethina tumida TaxID=116153 RepID=UPI00096B1115|nr:uncharacterized protein LOC109599330 [Aethina tumida]XP_049823362.1 uncharacterized protein LOC109599330 [Aethina tumida]XP_049823365.1 uncharacterized protein LOC109599330 [Aethina tumida]XP_049823369.1 uncharacterized protein LOC109599330 [Aethina tumida]XP_049823373.1 uncharacterized protein LOC109599330 [Aethina tumida]XP_049823381.1 uncharacterized protein LOC109599330 [Aethina tumida]XP_049823385.1 uncharacterized protein LOC109599330 [Aethina tumida]
MEKTIKNVKDDDKELPEPKTLSEGVLNMYENQLRLVKSALIENPRNENLIQFGNDLDRSILYGVIGMHEHIRLKAQKVNGTHDSNPKQYLWQVGDTVYAQWMGNGQHYKATIADVYCTGTVLVFFHGYDVMDYVEIQTIKLYTPRKCLYHECEDKLKSKLVVGYRMFKIKEQDRGDEYCQSGSNLWETFSLRLLRQNLNRVNDKADGF